MKVLDNGVYRDATPEEIAARQADAEDQPSEAEIVAAGMALVQGHLDQVARSYGYDHILSMVGYADEPSVERYRLEGQAARAWRSLCWAKAEEIRDAVKAGNRELPSDTQLLAEMPAIDLPYPGPFA